MNKIFNNTTYFYYPTLLAIIIGVPLLTIFNTGDIILAVSESRSDFWNTFFFWATKIGEEPFYVLFLFIFIFINIRYALLLPIIGIAATLVSFGLKAFFLHPRPKVFFAEQMAAGKINIIEGVHMIGGLTSFPSGHTISGFCLFGFAAYAFSTFKHRKILQFLCFILALIVGFSRIYLFQHFLKDVVLGMFIGGLLALLLSWFSENYLNESGKWYNQTIVAYFSKSSSPRA